MLPEFAQLALILALQLALVQGVFPLAGAARGNAAWMALARPAAFGQWLLLTFAFACLAHAFVSNDFSVVNVGQHSSSRLPLIYRFTASWGSHEGSMLLWTLMLAAWSLVVAVASRRLEAAPAARMLGVLGLVSAGFIAYILFASNPFLRIFPPPPEGNDLNPLLQDPGMVLHPPLLYLGYVGFAVAFAGAVAALLDGRLDSAWARWWRPWTTLAWVFLTAGIALGSWWAYTELGWGGWWFWDPTENASLMPWLLGTALVHSLAVSEKRGALRRWTLFLAIATFSFSLIGTFLVRSGVLSSVHAFALDPARGLFILSLLGLTIGGSLLLFALRAGRLEPSAEFAAFSRESLLLGNNVLLLVATATVLLGTLYPLLLDALGLGKVSVGPPYFNAVIVPLAVPLLCLMGLGPLTDWQRAHWPDLLSRLKWVAAASVAGGLVVVVAAGPFKPQAALGLALAAWILLATGLHLFRRRAALSRSLLGMVLAHCGVAVLVLGISLVSAYESERSVAMKPGDASTLAGYRFAFAGVEEAQGPNYAARIGRLEVTRDGQAVTVLAPEKRVYFASRLPMTEAAIDYGLGRDLYAALGEALDEEGTWSLRLFHKPFVGWLWGGAALMLLGGLVAGSASGRAR